MAWTVSEVSEAQGMIRESANGRLAVFEAAREGSTPSSRTCFRGSVSVERVALNQRMLVRFQPLELVGPVV